LSWHDVVIPSASRSDDSIRPCRYPLLAQPPVRRRSPSCHAPSRRAARQDGVGSRRGTGKAGSGDAWSARSIEQAQGRHSPARSGIGRRRQVRVLAPGTDPSPRAGRWVRRPENRVNRRNPISTGCVPSELLLPRTLRSYPADDDAKASTRLHCLLAWCQTGMGHEPCGATVASGRGATRTYVRRGCSVLVPHHQQARSTLAAPAAGATKMNK